MIFHAKVKPRSRITGSKYRKRSIFVFDKNRSFKTFTLRSGGQTFVTFLFDSVYTWLIPVPMALLLCHLTALPILAVYAIVQAADLIKVLVGYVLIRRGVWISNLVEEV